MVSNGKIPASDLHSILGGGSLPKGPATSFNAMVLHAMADGIDIRSVGAYRAYETQVAIFTTRYTRTPIATVDIRWWNGERWYRKPGYAAAAVPGTSNHGWGLAVDIANASYPYGGTKSAIYAWLEKHACEYGWVHPTWARNKNTWEPWHWEYHAELDQFAQRKIEMKYFNRGTSKKTLTTTEKWQPIPISDDGKSYAVLSGARGAFTSVLSGRLKGLTGEKVYVRAVRYSADAKGVLTVNHTFPSVLVPVVNGEARINVTQIGSVEKNQIIRWQVYAPKGATLYNQRAYSTVAVA